MIKNLIIFIFLLFINLNLFSQRVIYTDLIGSRFELSNPPYPGVTMKIDFKDSVHLIWSRDTLVVRAFYLLDTLGPDTKMIIRGKEENIQNQERRFFLIRKTDDHNLKMQEFRSDKSMQWDIDKDNSHTFIMIIKKGTVSPAR